MATVTTLALLTERVPQALILRGNPSERSSRCCRAPSTPLRGLIFEIVRQEQIGILATNAAIDFVQGRGPPVAAKYFVPSHKATLTRLINTGTSTNGPITAANASPELIPNTATATAMASSKLLLAAVKESVVDLE